MKYYSTILENLAHRSTEATVSLLGAQSTELRSYLRNQLSSDTDGSSKILSDPVFEAIFPWKEAEVTMQDLIPDLLHPDLVHAMDQPLRFKEEHGFPKTRHPYVHQIAAWRILSNQTPKSIIVTSGTGSGKTECFMVPILSDVVSQLKAKSEKLEGVQALFIYPLNALINSQRERLSAWTSRFEGSVRFCLYNGNTPERIKADLQNANPSEVMSREGLRASPPPVLITNATMLEYMLIRNIDRPIIEKSKGKLRYIVLDEAHTYIGSQAAELSLLIRRTLHAFDVTPSQIRFIATSATISSDSRAKESLKKYLSDLAGVSEDNIEIVAGTRSIPQLPEGRLNAFSADEILALEKEVFINSVTYSKLARQIRSKLIQAPQTLTELSEALFENTDEHCQRETIKWIDVCSNEALFDFLPLRGHFYHRVVHGLWACVNSHCDCKKGTALDTPNWPFGKVYSYQRVKCECGSVVYEMVVCNECNAVHLSATTKNNRLLQSDGERIDEFSLETEDEVDDGQVEPALEGPSREVILGNKEGHDYYSLTIDQDGNLNTGSTGDVRIFVNDTSGSCANCGYKVNGSGGSTFRHAYFGTPFYASQILPTLLENCKIGTSDPFNRPFQGRSLITFTDSRQGTARIAAKIQQDAERMRTRGLILEHVLALKENGSNESNRSIAASLKASNTRDPNIVAALKKLEELIKLNETPSITWSKLLDKCQTSPDIFLHMLDYYRSLNPDIFNNAESLTKILLTREFGRRPKRANSLETLGLVKVDYMGLENAKTPPKIWLNQNLTLDDWKDFLKICLDFHVRGQVFVEIPVLWLNWLGSKVSSKFLLPPDAPITSPSSRYVVWPKYDKRRGRRQHRLVRLLAHATDLDLDTLSTEEEDFLDVSMYEAWVTLTRTTGILQGTTFFQLPLERMEFRSVSKAWQCPVTLKVLDTTLKGFTPYLPIHATLGSHKCREIIMPAVPKFSSQHYDDRLSEIRLWFSDSLGVNELRNLGVWTNQTDRIVEGGFFFRSAEHSAQQPPERLKQYEESFKQGKVNVLNCSTTMEMGVDIGGLSMVVNNNVPPHPSNYLQRAGRAGRRRETRSLVLTLCKNDSHDQAVFHNPKWPFNTALKKPSITLNSERIVQRHLNALIFTFLLNEKYRDINTERIRLECSWFFLPQPDQGSICNRMCLWLQEMSFGQVDPVLERGIRSILSYSVLEGTSISSLMDKSKQSLRDIETNWFAEYNQLTHELRNAKDIAESDPYKRRIINDITRLEKEYLLTELVARGFLPSYGFPTGIASFNPYNIEAYKKQKKYKGSREDNTQIIRALPSRNLSIAIREYAPGADVVLDGLVYTSEGLTLNWHIPQNDSDVKENQRIRNAWRCEKCGNVGTSGVQFKDICTNCGEAIALQNKFEFIQPSGFATGFYSTPTNDISTQQYIPIAEPRISAPGELRPLPNSSVGHYRSSQNGTILYYSEGQNGTGYALCFECGRAESMPFDATMRPKMADGHDRLRGKQEGESSCSGGANRIKTRLRLGYEDRTDVFELILKYPQTNEYFLAQGVTKDENYSLAWTLAAAFRQGLASILGINSEELGFTVKPNKIDGHAVYTICLFDNCGGGAGFASSAPQFLDKLFDKAREFLMCPSNCDGACEHCLLQHDSRKIAHLLDRTKGLAYLTSDLVKAISLPDEDKLLGEDSTFCSQDFFEEIDFAARKGGMSLSIPFGGSVNDWDISASTLRKKIISYASTFESVILLLSEYQYSNLDADQKRDLYSILSFADNISTGILNTTPALNKGYLLAQVYRADLVISFATVDETAIILTDAWGRTERSLTVRSTKYPPIQVKAKVDKSQFFPTEKQETFEIDIHKELNGKIKDFGRLLVDKLLEKDSILQRNFTKGIGIRKISYSDRFISSPLQVLLLSEFFRELLSRSAGKVDTMLVTSLTVGDPARFGARRAYSNWNPDEEADRTELLKMRMEQLVRNFHFDLVSDRKQISHARVLELEWRNGDRVRIRLDQGMGYWNVINSPSYPFDATIEEQANWLRRRGLELEIVNNSDLPTHLFVSVK